MAGVREPTDLVVASYNIHRCIGTDGQKSPERVAEVLEDLNADVVALQEVDSALPEHGIDQLAFLAKALDYTPVAGPTLVEHHGRYGNGLLTRLPVAAVRRVDLSFAGREPRGALDVDLGGLPLRVIATHFGLRRRERHWQARTLAGLLALSTGPSLLLGDVNEWLPGSSALTVLEAQLGPARGGPTFPSRLPVLRLDRILVRPRAALLDVGVHRTRLARLASDHLPIRARLDGALLRQAV
jgi:endonuclease/exonuclease/phosphatase family metal-dependent hydrolase